MVLISFYDLTLKIQISIDKLLCLWYNKIEHLFALSGD